MEKNSIFYHCPYCATTEPCLSPTDEQQEYYNTYHDALKAMVIYQICASCLEKSY